MELKQKGKTSSTLLELLCLAHSPRCGIRPLPKSETHHSRENTRNDPKYTVGCPPLSHRDVELSGFAIDESKHFVKYRPRLTTTHVACHEQYRFLYLETTSLSGRRFVGDLYRVAQFLHVTAFHVICFNNFLTTDAHHLDIYQVLLQEG